MVLGTGPRTRVRAWVFAFCGAAALSLIVLAIGWAALLASINRPMPPVTEQEARESFQRSVRWLQANEAAILADGNAALWWMIRAAADNSRNAYLNELVDKHLLTYTGPHEQLAWKRLIVRDASFDPHQPVPPGLVPYQRGFFLAAMCQPGQEPDESTRRFLSQHACRPALTRVWLSDRVCSTHQLLVVMLYRRQGCQAAASLEPFKQELLDDIATQASQDIFMHDGQIQRVLSLVWAGAADRVRPAWVHRIRAQQRADGGWTGDSLVPELPDWAQVPAVKRAWRMMRGLPPLPSGASNFHATAQGLLLMSLLAPAQQLITADGG